jgi:glycogen debranching enzyme
VTLRLRGSRGLGLRLEPIGSAVAYSIDERLVTLNVGILRRYQVECISGEIKAAGLWRCQQTEKVYVDLWHGEGDDWEAAIDEYWSTWTPRTRRSFSACLGTSQESFGVWLAGMPPVPPGFAQAREVAAYINWSCVLSPVGFLRRPAMLMSKNWMCNVWSWDNCFNAMSLAKSQGDLAWDQLLLMVDHQDQYGAYPDGINDSYVSYNYSKPPIHGWATLDIRERNPSAATQPRLTELYGSLERWTYWWLNYRRLPDQRLPHYLHGNDSGWDNGTIFDEGVPLVVPDLAAFLIMQMDALSSLARLLDRESEARTWAARADQLLDALLEELWLGDHFIAKLALSGRVVESQSLILCMPILLGERLPVGVRASLAARIESFLSEYGPATEHPASTKYVSDGYWRGPIWAPSTYIIVSGLERSGHRDLARRIAHRFCSLCTRSGFAENFDALTGEPLRDPAYTWTSSVFLLLAEWLREVGSKDEGL